MAKFFTDFNGRDEETFLKKGDLIEAILQKDGQVRIAFFRKPGRSFSRIWIQLGEKKVKLEEIFFPAVCSRDVGMIMRAISILSPAKINLRPKRLQESLTNKNKSALVYRVL